MSTPPRPLGDSLWWHIVLPRGIALLAWWGANQLVQLPTTLVWALIAADALVLFWASRAHLRAADEHMISSGAMAPIWGGYLLLLFSVLASLSLWWQALLISQRLPEGVSYAEQRALEREARYSLTLSEDGTQLSFKGEITFGLTKRLSILLQDHPEIVLLRLSGPGGHIYEARGAAQLIRARGLNTETQGLCASACTLMFAAGKSRRLGQAGQLGFHGYALTNFGGLPQVDLEKEQLKDGAYLIRQGLTQDFVNQIFATPATGLWRPSMAELRESSVLRP